MARPELVARCVASMQGEVDCPVTVKSRIGIDNRESLSDLLQFVEKVAAAGCKVFIIHARIAVLSGLSPKENREIPPLRYERVFVVKETFPELTIVINGGITSLAQAQGLMEVVDGVMLGREAYQNPFILHQVDPFFYETNTPIRQRRDYLMNYLPYVEQELAKGTPLKHMSRHLLGLYKGQPGGKQFRRHLSENSYLPDAGIDVIMEALDLVD